MTDTSEDDGARLNDIADALSPLTTRHGDLVSEVMMIITVRKLARFVTALSDELFELWLEALVVMIEANDTQGASKVLHPLVRYLVEEEAEPFMHLQFRGDAIFVRSSHSDPGGRHVTDYPSPSCDCPRFLGIGEFDGRAGVCSHLLLVAFFLATGGRDNRDIERDTLTMVLEMARRRTTVPPASA